MNPDSEVNPGSAGHQPGNIFNPGFRLRRRPGLRNKSIWSRWARHYGTMVYGRLPPRGLGIQVNKLKNAGLVPGAPGAKLRNPGLYLYSMTRSGVEGMG